MTRTRHGKRLEFTPRDIEIFKLLSRYRYLRSTYIHAFVGGASETRFKERLGDLFHEGYLGRPKQQWEFADARFLPAVHELGAGATRVLRESGGETAEAYTFLNGAAYRQFRHSLMICEALATLELGIQMTPTLRFISWPEILAQVPEAIRTSATPFRLPVPPSGYLVPDGVFGIEYRTEDTKTYRFFALEADRGTMPVVRSNAGQTSYLGKLATYGAAVCNGMHKKYWGIPNLLVLTLTTSETRLAEILRRASEGSINAGFLFKAVSERELARPMSGLVTEPWARTGAPPLSVAMTS
jgi:hypothetical protein